MLSIKTERMQTMVNLISGIGAMIVNAVINFCLAPFIVETMGEEANGFTQLANNFVTYASMITLAFNSMAGRFISVSYHQKKYEKAKSYYSSMIMNNVLIDIVLVPLALFVIKNLDEIIIIENTDSIDVKVLFACVFLNFFLNQFVSVYNVSMFITNSLYYQNLLNLIRYALNGILLLIVFEILPARLYYVSFVSCVLTVGILFVTRCIKNKILPELKFEFKTFHLYAVKEMLLSGVWNTVNQCGHMLMTGLDLLLCNLFISPGTMGILSVAKTIPNCIISLANVLNSSFAPALTINWAKGEKQNLLEQLRGNMKISSIIISIPIITFCSFGIPFYSLWMPSIDAEQLTILSFLTCMAFIPWAGPQTLYNVFTATNRLKVNSIAFVCSGIINTLIVFGCLKYSDIGVYAVAGVSSIITIIRNIFLTVPYTAKLLNVKWYTFYKDVFISIMCCLINFVVAGITQKIYIPTNWFELGVQVFVTCIFTLGMDIICVLNKKEKKLLFNVLRRKIDG